MSTVEQPRVKKARWCTDVFCLVIFLIFWAILIFISAFAFVIGNPFRLIYGLDSFGNVCGLRNEQMGSLSLSGLNMTDRPYVFYLNMADISNSMKICVKKCPNRFIENEMDLMMFEKETGTKLCRYDFNQDGSSFLYPVPENASLAKTFQLIEENYGYGPCPKMPIYPTKSVMNRCVPKAAFDLTKDAVYSIYGYLNSFDTFQQTVSDLYASRLEITTMILLSLLLSVLMVLLIHFVAAFVSWIIMLIVSLASIAVTGVLWWTYIDIKYHLDTTPFEQLLEESAKNERAFLTYSIGSTILTVLLLLIVFVMRKRVKFVVALFQEAGHCIRNMPCLLVQPLWTFIALVLFFVFWLAVLLALATADYPERREVKSPFYSEEKLMKTLDIVTTGTPTENVTPSVNAYTLVSYTEPSWARYMWWFHAIALIWVSEFILACQQMVIASSVAMWYFSREKNSLKCPIGHSVLRLIFYHMGSLALGSFLITVFKIPRLILQYVESKLKKNSNSAVARCCLKCCQCCLCCFEKFLRYLNHNAYTVIAIRGVGFCKGAQEAFISLVSNALRVAAINSVGDFILFLGKCAVTALSAFVGILMMKHDPELHFYAVPVFIGSVFSFFIAHCVLSVYEMVIDILFLCFCEDLKMNDGSPGKEYFAPPGLMKFFKEHGDVGDSAQPLRELPGKQKADESDGEQRNV
ncbi:choline transporter-like 1 [Centruroides vittatus]|uniref:choline transporter-like 1 n=1 Tax=Centruroides vittatus TaxID=120091 RepID=UPI00350EBFB5